jgi:hypothetical protein
MPAPSVMTSTTAQTLNLAKPKAGCLEGGDSWVEPCRASASSPRRAPRRSACQGRLRTTRSWVCGRVAVAPQAEHDGSNDGLVCLLRLHRGRSGVALRTGHRLSREGAGDDCRCRRGSRTNAVDEHDGQAASVPRSHSANSRRRIARLVEHRPGNATTRAPPRLNHMHM